MDLKQTIRIYWPGHYEHRNRELSIELINNDRIMIRHIERSEEEGQPDVITEIKLPDNASAELVIAFQNIHNAVRLQQ